MDETAPPSGYCRHSGRASEGHDHASASHAGRSLPARSFHRSGALRGERFRNRPSPKLMNAKVSEGAIRARRHRVLCRRLIGAASPLEITPGFDRAIDPFWVSKQSLEAGDEVLKPGCGWLARRLDARRTIRRALRALSRNGEPTALDYGPPPGLLPLRQRLSRRLADQGLMASPDQVLLTDLGTHAIDLLCRFHRAGRHGACR